MRVWSVAALAGLLVLPGCASSVRVSAVDDASWRSSAGQAMSDPHPRPLRDETCRQALRLSAGGTSLRLRLSHALGDEPLALASLSVGVRESGAAVLPSTGRQVTVGGSASVDVPAGAAVWTDPVELATEPGDDLLVSFAVRGEARVSEHRFGAATGWCSGSGTGDLTGTPAGDAFVRTSRAGLVVDDVSVAGSDLPPAVVAVGDSLTDDALFPVDSHQRWTDVLAETGDRLVVNAAIAGNCVVAEGGYGPPLVERFERDVLSRSGIGVVVVLAGTNDIAQRTTADELVAAFEQLAAAARERGVQVVHVTIPPAAQRTPEQAAARHAVNAWIREQPAVVDADRLLQDRQDPERLAVPYDVGDGLHLSVRGHRALAAAVAAALDD